MNGDGPQAFEHWIGRLCEEFQCRPSEAWQEWLRLPVGMLEQIIEYRHYARAKALVDGATTAEARKQLPDWEMVDVVTEIEFELVEEARASRP